MRILFTGASSFTGYWFVRELVEAGHQVIAAFRGDGQYEGVRAERARMVRSMCETHANRPLGSTGFLDLVRSGAREWDVLCHHGAEVGDYSSEDFHPFRAAARNLHRLPELMAALKDRGCARLVLTGTVFEQGEGAGSMPLRAFSPYGLSKGLTAATAEFYAAREGFTFEKFVIPNPFGPYEEARFTSYLLHSWLANKTTQVRTPRYVRDNIPVTLLAKAYARFVSTSPISGAARRLNPSFYAESQGAFAQRVRQAVASRLALSCNVELCYQTEFPEPAVRINTDPQDIASLEWDEDKSWDEFVGFYARRLSSRN